MGRAERMNPKHWRTQNGGGLPTDRDIKDRFGRILQIGDVLLLDGKGSIPWRIADLKPDLDPRAPAGQQVIVLVTDIITRIPPGVQVQDFIKIQDASELPPLPGQPPPATPELREGEGGGELS